MVTDRYTKVVLTIIAVLLAFNVLRDVPLIKSAQAQNEVIHVIVDHISGSAFNNAEPIEVKCTSGCGGG